MYDIPGTEPAIRIKYRHIPTIWPIKVLRTQDKKLLYCKTRKVSVDYFIIAMPEQWDGKTKAMIELKFVHSGKKRTILAKGIIKSPYLSHDKLFSATFAIHTIAAEDREMLKNYVYDHESRM